MKRLVNRRNRRDDRLLERPCRRDQMIDHIGAGTGFDGKACTPGVAGNALDLDAGLDRRVECAGIALEVLGHLLLAREPVLIHGEFKAGKPVMPGRTVGHQRVPAATAPRLGNAVFFKHRCSMPRRLRCSLVATPACPAPTTSVSISMIFLSSRHPSAGDLRRVDVRKWMKPRRAGAKKPYAIRRRASSQ